MSDARPDYATPFMETDQPHAEVVDPTTQEVWQTLDVCDREALAALDLPEPLRPVGSGTGAMDEHWFDRSPGASNDGPMRVRDFAGHAWGHCAKPAALPAKPFGENGPTEMMVDKHHALRFADGRRVPVLRTPEGDLFVHVIAGGPDSTIGLAGSGASGELVVPDGCTLGEVALEKDWVLRLPHPTRVFFFASGDSFQGPIESLPAEWEPIG